MEIKEQIKQTKERKKGFVKALPNDQRRLLKLYEQAKAGEKRSLIGIGVWVALLIIAYVVISLVLPYANNWIWNGVVALVLIAGGTALLLFLRKSYKEKAQALASAITDYVHEYEGIKDRIRQLEKAEKERADAARKAERAEERARVAREKAEREAALAHEQAERARKETEAALGVQAPVTDDLPETEEQPAEPEPVAEPVPAEPVPAITEQTIEPAEPTPLEEAVAAFEPVLESAEESTESACEAVEEAKESARECAAQAAETISESSEAIEDAVEAFTSEESLPETPEQIVEDAKDAFSEIVEDVKEAE